MKLSKVAVVVIIAVAAFQSAAQSVVVRPEKRVYKRTGADVPDFKREFEVRYPRISGRVSAAARRGILQNIDYWRVFKMSLRDNLRDEHWLSGFDYEVKYNKHNLLDIWLTCEGIGPYPDSSQRYIVIDIRTGKKLQLRDLFTPARLAGLRNLIRRKMRAAEAAEDAEVREMLKEERQTEIYPQFHPGPDKLELKHLSGFSISDKGVTFIYDYGYPHVSQALEPTGEFFVSYAELKPFISSGGLLQRFVR